MVSKMLHTCLRVENLEKSIAFYADAFGFKELRRKDFPEHQLFIWGLKVMSMSWN